MSSSIISQSSDQLQNMDFAPHSFINATPTYENLETGGCQQSLDKPNIPEERKPWPHYLDESVRRSDVIYNIAGEALDRPDWNHSQRDLHAKWSAQFQPTHCSCRSHSCSLPRLGPLSDKTLFRCSELDADCACQNQGGQPSLGNNARGEGCSDRPAVSAPKRKNSYTKKGPLGQTHEDVKRDKGQDHNYLAGSKCRHKKEWTFPDSCCPSIELWQTNEARNSFDFDGVDTCSSTLSNSYRGGAGWGEKPSSCRSGILNPSWPSRGDVYQRHRIPCPVGRVRISLYGL